MSRRRKTKRMEAMEREHGRPIECLIADMVQEKGQSATADELGMSKATLGYWMLKADVTVARVALLPGDIVEVKRGDAWGRDTVMTEKQRIVA